MAPVGTKDHVLLARRLRQLRLERWPGITVTQQALARALSAHGHLSVSTVSAYESERTPTIPPDNRLQQLATFFATRRSIDDGGARLLEDSELTEKELEQRDALFEELRQLRSLSPRTQTGALEATRVGLWHFGNDALVRLLCVALPEEDRSVLASPSQANYAELLSYADLDALVELFGHIRAQNPSVDIRFRLSSAVESVDLAAHVVLLGGMWRNRTSQWMASMAALPIRQVPDKRFRNGEVFEVEGPEGITRHVPVFQEEEPALGLVEDVGLLLRMTNPNNTARTLTICTGIYSRGVLGAVRCLTDAQLRTQNEEYLMSRFGRLESFAVLMRVRVHDGHVLTPDLSDANIRLWEWPQSGQRQ